MGQAIDPEDVVDIADRLWEVHFKVAQGDIIVPGARIGLENVHAAFEYLRQLLSRAAQRAALSITRGPANECVQAIQSNPCTSVEGSYSRRPFLRSRVSQTSEISLQLQHI